MSRQPATRFALIAALFALFSSASPVKAQTNYYWNTTGGGAGTWNIANTNWSLTPGDPASIAWLNDGTALANFGGTGGTVTVGVPLTVYGLDFSVSNYTIAGTSLNTLTLAGPGGVINTNEFDASISAVLAGAVGLTKSGTGTLSLSGTNTYTGVTNISAGTVVITSTAALGATGAGNETTVASGASLTLGNIGFNPGETLTLNGTGTANEGALRKIGTTNSNWTAGITINSTARINNDSTGLLTLSGAIGIGGNTLRVGGAGNTTISGQISLSTSGTFIHDSPSTVSINNGLNGGATGTFLGSIQVTNGGTLSFNTQTALGTTNSTGTITLDNGTLLNTGTGNAGTYITTNRNIVLGPGGGTLRWDDTGLTSGSPNIIIIQNTAPGTTIQGTQGGALNKTGGGIIAIAQPATYDGPTNVLAGALRVRTNNNIFPIATALTVAAGATFDLNLMNQQVGSLAGAGDVNLSGGTFTVGNSTSTSFTGRFTDAKYAGNGGIGGKVTKVGTGTLTVGSGSFYSGATTISDGVLSVGSLNDGGVSGFTITTTAASNTATVSNATGLVVGMTIINRNLVTGTTITDITGTTITLSSPANLAVAANAAAAGFPSSIGISPSAAANLILNGGTLQYTGAAASTNRLFTLNAPGGAIDASGTGALTLAATGTVGGSGTRTLTLTGTNTGTNTFSPILGGETTSLTKDGAGQWVLGGLNTYGGATFVNAGTLTAGAANVLSASSAVSLANASGAVLNLNGFSQTIASLAGGGATGGNVSLGAATLTTGGSDASTTYGGVISGTGGLTKSGLGTQTLTGVNTYTGATNINAGTLHIGTGGSLASGSAVAVNNGATLHGTGTVGGAVTVNPGGTLGGGDGTSIGTLSIGGNIIANADAGGAARLAVTATPSSASLIAVTGTVNFATTGTPTPYVIDLNIPTLVVNTPYTFTILTSGGILSNGVGPLPNGTPFTQGTNYVLTSPQFSQFDNVSLTVGPSNSLVLTFTPVPEPTTILGLAAGVMGLGGMVRRRVRRA